jgi:hypothetical protein
VTILPSEGPSALGRCNCDTLSPKRNSNVGVMNRGSTDEAVVIVKFGADEFMVTWRRAKHRISDRMLEVKGGTRKRSLLQIRNWWFEVSLDKEQSTICVVNRE